MTAAQLKNSRAAAGKTQTQVASELGTTQAYVSMLERGLRRPSPRLARRLVKVLHLPPTANPFRVGSRGLSRYEGDRAAKGLAALGYPGFAYLGQSRAAPHPAVVLLGVLAARRVDARLLEALPWILLTFEDLDHGRIVALAHKENLQNRLGFVVALAKRVAQAGPRYSSRVPELDGFLAELEPMRLAREDDLGHPPKSERLRSWLRQNRSEAAAHWNLLTDLRPQHLRFVDEGDHAQADP